MERSLSLLLPVRDAQATLSQTVHRILEVASELTDQLELVIIDDGSTDATSEVAAELERNYPQVRSVRHGTPRGERESLQSGLRVSRGKVVLCSEPNGGSNVDELPRIWRSAAVGSVPAPPGSEYHLLDRRTGQQLHGPSRPARPNFLTQVRDFALGE
ncbi:MAG: glycosyltransferase [Patescibacteria group bacterium]|nr:glycosyltransferase [Patescibacteria group bacterium]